jgi:hypothetical protein
VATDFELAHGQVDNAGSESDQNQGANESSIHRATTIALGGEPISLCFLSLTTGSADFDHGAGFR